MPIVQELLIMRERVKLRTIGGDDFAIEILGAQAPIPAS
jgi:hypothetical protein